VATQTDWRPASFRGVTFSCAETPEYGGGRKVADHEIVDGEPFTEDTGADFATFSLAAQVVGADYRKQGDALEEALNKRGPGTLVHPTKGSISVQVGSWSATVQYQRITYKIDCKRSGHPLAASPTEIPDESVWTWTQTLRGTLNGAFTSAWSVAEEGAGVVTAAVASVNDAASAVLDAARKFASPDLAGSVLSQVEALAATADASVRLPSTLAGQWGELLAPMSRAGRDACNAALAAVPGPVGSTGDVIAGNADALAVMVRGGLAAALCDATVTDLPPTRDDALNALQATLDTLAAVAREMPDAETWRAMMDARDNTARVVGRLILTLPQTRVYSPPVAVSVFEVSQRLFGGGGMVDDLLTRNAIVSPLWIADPVRALVA